MYTCIYIYIHIWHIYVYIWHIYIYIHTYITLHYITLHYITLHYITLHYITLHYITLHYITLHTYIYIYIYIYNVCDYACVRIHLKVYQPRIFVQPRRTTAQELRHRFLLGPWGYQQSQLSCSVHSYHHPVRVSGLCRSHMSWFAWFLSWLFKPNNRGRWGDPPRNPVQLLRKVHCHCHVKSLSNSME